MIDESSVLKRHHLPHLQRGGACYFVSFSALRRHLAPVARQIVLDALRHFDGERYRLVAAVVMANHVHMLLTVLKVDEGHWHDLSLILKSLKGYSARQINISLGTSGSVWRAESYDRIVRDEADFAAKLEYIRHNAVKAGMVRYPEQYEYFYAANLIEE
jgi:REP element-mobilizing transposase RayT